MNYDWQGLKNFYAQCSRANMRNLLPSGASMGMIDGNYHGGALSEYLAQYGLSLFSFVVQIPRQQDFGVVDFVCTLYRKNKTTNPKHANAIYPENSFYVQVKSDHSSFTIDRDRVNWIFKHMDNPLLICVSDKSKNKLSFYQTSSVWDALYTVFLPIVISFGGSQKREIVDYNNSDDGELRKWEICLGAPILEIDLNTIDQSGLKKEFDLETIYPVIVKWIQQDAMSIMNGRMGRITTSRITSWKTNEIPQESEPTFYHGPDYEQCEKSIFNILCALAINYARAIKDGPPLAPEKRKQVEVKLNSLKSLISEVDDPSDLKTKVFNIIDTARFGTYSSMGATGACGPSDYQAPAAPPKKSRKTPT